MMTDRSTPHSDRLAIASGALLALLPALLLFLLLRRPIWDVDIFWQLKLGEMALAQGHRVTREPFAATHLGEALPSFAWLGQMLLAQIRLWWGWAGLRLFDALCWLCAMGTVAWACRRRGASDAGVMTGLVVAFIVALPYASVRPQSLALLCFGLLLALLRLRGPAWRRLLLAALLLPLWQNLHPSVAIAIVYLGSLAAMAWLDWLRGRTDAPPWEPALLMLLAVSALAATPEGLSIFAGAADNARESRAMQVSEWLPLWDAGNRAIAGLVLAALLVAGWMAVRLERTMDWPATMAATTLLCLSLVAGRFVPFWAVAMIPVFAGFLPSRSAVRAPRWTGPVGALALVAAGLTAGPTAFSVEIPVRQIERLHAQGVKGVIFAHFPWGGPVIDIGYPGSTVAYDGRYYRYSAAEWARYRRLTAGEARPDELERLYTPAAYVLSPDWTPSLIAALKADRAHWRLFSEDRTAVIFVRRSQP